MKIIIKIRTFEELILDLFGQNKLSGTTHTYIGEEATAAAVMKYVRNDDKVFSNHRCHGHYLAYGGPEELLLAEIMSKKSGLCQGRGGSQHIHYKNFFTNGIQGGIVPNAVGAAFADKLCESDRNAVVFLGDGTLGQGVVYESLNIAAVYEIPVLFVIEDNQYAMSTRRSDVIAGNIKSRIEGFGIRTFEIESTDVDELDVFFEEVFYFLEEKRKPVCAIVHNYRLGAHSKGDDTRNPEEIKAHQKDDPVKIVINKIGEESYREIRNEFQVKFESIVEKLEKEESIEISTAEMPLPNIHTSFLARSDNRYVEGIRQAFRERLSTDRNTVLIGEDIRDPYGGAFKATKGLTTDFDDRILNMPISEAAMTGIAVGMGLNGMLPVVEMMFGDFVTLGFDQLLNHAAKYGWVYGNNVSVPMVIRTPMGAKRGYGPTHSQSLEKYLVGIPGIRVLALSLAVDPKIMYETLFSIIDEPVIVVENKKLYAQKGWIIKNNTYRDFSVREINHYGFPTLLFSIDPENRPDFLAVTYGGMIEDAMEAAEELMITDEIQMDVLILSQLAPLPLSDILEVITCDIPLLVIEEGTKTAGLGAEIIAACSERGIVRHCIRIAAPDMPIPNGIVLENQIIPDKDTIIKRVKEEMK